LDLHKTGRAKRSGKKITAKSKAAIHVCTETWATSVRSGEKRVQAAAKAALPVPFFHNWRRESVVALCAGDGNKFPERQSGDESPQSKAREIRRAASE